MCFLFIPLGLPHRVKGASLDFHPPALSGHCCFSPRPNSRLRKSRRNPAQPRPEGREGVLAQAFRWRSASGNYLGHCEQRQLRKPRSDQAETGENKQARLACGGSKWQASPSRALEPGRRRCQPRGPGRGAPSTAFRPPPPPQPTPIPSCPALAPPQGRGPRRLLPGGWVRRCQRAASHHLRAGTGLTARAPPLPLLGS